MMNESQVRKLRSMPVPLDADVPSEGTLRQPTAPVALPCHGPGCDEIVITHTTDEDKAATPTVEIRRLHPVTGEQRRSTFWFCSEDCRTAFIQSSEREVDLTEEDRR
jgi:hypothetical protein